MKRYIITAIFALGFMMNASAQSDRFFDYSNTEKRSNTFGQAPAVPPYHGGTNHEEVPLGGGLLVLTALGIVYKIKTRRDASM